MVRACVTCPNTMNCPALGSSKYVGVWGVGMEGSSSAFLCNNTRVHVAYTYCSERQGAGGGWEKQGSRLGRGQREKAGEERWIDGD